MRPYPAAAVERAMKLELYVGEESVSGGRAGSETSATQHAPQAAAAPARAGQAGTAFLPFLRCDCGQPVLRKTNLSG